MQRLKSILSDLRHQQDGATAIEYGLIIALIVLAILVAMQGLADVTIDMWNDVSDKTVAATTG